MKFYKSALFLFCLNGLFIWLASFFLDVRFFIPVFAFLACFNVCLFYLPGFYLRRAIPLSVFPADDPYKAYKTFESLKAKGGAPNMRLFKAVSLNSSFFCLSYGRQAFVVLSEDILESFSQEEMRHFLAYPLQLAQSGDLAFLTLLGGFLLSLDRLLRFLFYPFSFLKRRKSRKRENLILLTAFKALSLATRGIFYTADKNSLSGAPGTAEQNFISLSAGRIESGAPKLAQQKALALWRLAGLMDARPPQTPSFMAPLFLTNPLTNSTGWRYISLQPLIKDRVKCLIGAYPP